MSDGVYLPGPDPISVRSLAIPLLLAIGCAVSGIAFSLACSLPALAH